MTGLNIPSDAIVFINGKMLYGFNRALVAKKLGKPIHAIYLKYNGERKLIIDNDIMIKID